MRFRWPADMVFHRQILDVEQTACPQCGGGLHVCDHRIHRFYTFDGPVELCCRLAHCADPACAARGQTLSPASELALTLPWWRIGWDVFCWMGHRRFARHWSVPQIQAELLDSHRIPLSDDAISDYLHRYQAMVAARQQDPQQLALAYRDIACVVLTIDGLQPEKGHETLYAVRELKARRVWFAEALLSSNAAEVKRLLGRARQMAKQLARPVQLWLSDKQDAFVTGIADEFDGIPHRYCSNHFLRDLAKPMLKLDSQAKVKLRQKVRGLRGIERQVLQQRQHSRFPSDAAKQVTSRNGAAQTCASATQDATAPRRAEAAAAEQRQGTAAASAPCQAPVATKDQVVLDYCAAVRGILNGDQGGPLSPPGLRMAEALAEVRASLERNLKLNRPGPAHGQLQRLAGCIDRGLNEVKAKQRHVEKQVKEIALVAATLDESTGSIQQRQARYEQLQEQYEAKSGKFFAGLAKVMKSFAPGLFVAVEGKQGEKLPSDNLALERWFRKPKGHERRIHGRRHAGVRIVQEGATLLLTLNAHEGHPQPFTAEELLPYRDAQDPAEQQEALHRRKVMRKARSKKNDRNCS